MFATLSASYGINSFVYNLTTLFHRFFILLSFSLLYHSAASLVDELNRSLTCAPYTFKCLHVYFDNINNNNAYLAIFTVCQTLH